jgi:hypothetical protein
MVMAVDAVGAKKREIPVTRACLDRTLRKPNLLRIEKHVALVIGDRAAFIRWLTMARVWKAIDAILL